MGVCRHKQSFGRTGGAEEVTDPDATPSTAQSSGDDTPIMGDTVTTNAPLPSELLKAILVRPRSRAIAVSEESGMFDEIRESPLVIYIGHPLGAPTEEERAANFESYLDLCATATRAGHIVITWALSQVFHQTGRLTEFQGSDWLRIDATLIERSDQFWWTGDPSKSIGLRAELELATFHRKPSRYVERRDGEWMLPMRRVVEAGILDIAKGDYLMQGSPTLGSGRTSTCECANSTCEICDFDGAGFGDHQEGR